MSVWSKMSEDEIKKRQAELDVRHDEQERRGADLDRRSGAMVDERKNLDRAWAELMEQRDALAKTEARLFASEQALAAREAAAKAGFVEQQREAFREVIESRTKQLDARQLEVEEVERQHLAAMEARHATCADRELSLQERDTQAAQRHLQLEQRAEELRAREERVAEAERERDAGFTENRRNLDLELRAARKAMENRAEELRTREAQVIKAEQDRDAGYTENRRQLDAELHAQRQVSEEESNQRRLQRLSELQAELVEERRRRRAELSRDLEADRAQSTEDIIKQRQAFEDQRSLADAAIKHLQQEANQRVADLTVKEVEIDRQRRALDAETARLEERRQTLDEEVEQAAAERKASFAQKEESLKAENVRLRGQIQSADKLTGLFENLKRQLGGRDAALVLADLEAQASALHEAREQITQRTPGMRAEFDALCAERDRLASQVEERSKELTTLKERVRGEDSLRLDLQQAQDATRWLTTQTGLLEGRCNQLEEENRRLRNAYEREEDREARIRDIVTPEVSKMSKPDPKYTIGEIEWLDEIASACTEYGLRFHPRILRAFHTALKTAEWSPLTVLAGVSGTGKSELPRLYAHFGGMTFKSLAVQPNWDSQESMLGFFNSIDNRFDAQPLLRLLARSQKPWTEMDHGLEDSVVLVLLDEMNLAHAELYFAEFLSKLELRRGCKGNDVPALEVKLGAGLLPFQVPMGRNVLWTGTMNQDETTKSLSDKVLDRSIVINFPRPASLERRKELMPLPTAKPLLPRKVWEKWWVKKSEFSDDQIKPFLEIIESINQAMSSVGRALGHRVWQSIEYYMANYPDVLAAQKSNSQQDLKRAMHIAFEDQLVQKVMPKLRGIDTRGRGRTLCLDKVKGLLADNKFALVDDFELSCECGYGQFIWQTVSFLQDSPEVESTATVEPNPAQSEANSTDQVLAEPQPAEDLPPPNFKPNEPDRVALWKATSKRNRQLYLTDGGKR